MIQRLVLTAATVVSLLWLPGCNADCKLGPINTNRLYELPWEEDTCHEMGQGAFTGQGRSHQGRYAWDFRLPEGTPILAARAGTVIDVRESCPDCMCSNVFCFGCCDNFIVIQHGDSGTLARYHHLQNNGACVQVNDVVQRGDVIGFSGNAGCSSNPHLHFEVQNCEGPLNPAPQCGSGCTLSTCPAPCDGFSAATDTLGPCCNGGSGPSRGCGFSNACSSDTSTEAQFQEVGDDLGIPVEGNAYFSANTKGTDFCSNRGVEARRAEVTEHPGWETGVLGDFARNYPWPSVLEFLGDEELGAVVRVRFRQVTEAEGRSCGSPALGRSTLLQVQTALRTLSNVEMIDDTQSGWLDLLSRSEPVVPEIEYREPHTGRELLRILRRHGYGSPEGQSRGVARGTGPADICDLCPDFEGQSVDLSGQVPDIAQRRSGEPASDFQRASPTAAADLVFWFGQNVDPALLTNAGGPPFDPADPYPLVDLLAGPAYLDTSPATGTDPVQLVAGLQRFLDDQSPDRWVADLEMATDELPSDARCGLLSPLAEQGYPALVGLGLWNQDDASPEMFTLLATHTVVAVGYESTSLPWRPRLQIHDPGRWSYPGGTFELRRQLTPRAPSNPVGPIGPAWNLTGYGDDTKAFDVADVEFVISLRDAAVASRSAASYEIQTPAGSESFLVSGTAGPLAFDPILKNLSYFYVDTATSEGLAGCYDRTTQTSRESAPGGFPTDIEQAVFDLSRATVYTLDVAGTGVGAWRLPIATQIATVDSVTLVDATRLALDPSDGSLLVYDQGASELYRFHFNGAAFTLISSTPLAPPPLLFPTDAFRMTVSAVGDLYYTYGDGTVWLLAFGSTVPIAFTSVALTDPDDVAISGSGHLLYVADEVVQGSGQRSLRKYSSTGAYLGDYGGPPPITVGDDLVIAAAPARQDLPGVPNMPPGFDALWVGGTGSWNLAVNWASTAVPDGGDSAVFVGSSADLVTLDVDPSIGRLFNAGMVSIPSGRALQVSGPLRSLERLDVAGTLDVDGELRIEDGDLDVGAGGDVMLAGDFALQLTDESAWSWGTGSTLLLEGGSGAATGAWHLWASLELAGSDVGPAVFSNTNFDLTTLELSADVHVYLVDAVDNGNRFGPGAPDEALYVDALVLAADSVLNLNGLHLYAGGVSVGPGPFGGGQVIDQFVPLGVPAGRTDTQLTVGKAVGDQLQLDWGASCLLTDFDYAVYEGTIGSFASHVPLECTTGGLTSAVVTPSGPDKYYVVVPLSSNREGSYGRDGDGNERPPSAPGCLGQEIGDCP